MQDGPTYDERRDAALFLRRIFELTPRTWATPGIIAVNVAVFLFALSQGAGLFAPSVDALLALGGDNAALVAHGQWWRLFTSMFLHAGLVHVGMNMYVLSSGGRLVERLFGPVPFLVLYLLAGLAGSVTSLVVHPDISVGVGASGAIFGVFGGLGGYLVAERTFVPAVVLRSMRRALAEFVVLNVVIGLAVPFIDLSAHAGGLVAGALVGAALARPPTLDGVRSRLPRAALVLALGLAVIAGAAWLLVMRHR